MSQSNRSGILHLARSGGFPLMVIGLLARFPTAMTPMLLLVAIPVGGGSLVQGGAAVGLSALGTAASGLILGLLVDRFGARPVVAFTATAQSLSLVAMAAQFGQLDQSSLLLPLAFVVGLSNPRIGALARAEWMRRNRIGDLDTPASRSAMAWEASSSEAAFVVGPVLASLLLIVVSPSTSLLGLAVVGLLLHLDFARRVPLPPAASPHSSVSSDAQPPKSFFDKVTCRRPAVVALAALAISTSVGLVFGASQASVNAVLAEIGLPSLVGAIYGLLGIGSILGGLVWAQIPDHLRGPWVALASGAALLFLGVMAGNYLSLGIVSAGVICALTGIWLSPVLAESYNRARNAVTDKYQVTMVTMLTSGTSVGIGAGAPFASWLSTHLGSQAGFLSLAAAGVFFIIGGGLLSSPRGSGRARLGTHRG